MNSQANSTSFAEDRDGKRRVWDEISSSAPEDEYPHFMLTKQTNLLLVFVVVVVTVGMLSSMLFLISGNTLLERVTVFIVSLSVTGRMLLNLSFVLRGIVVGISIAAPVGPISIICMQRTVSNGYLYGFASGLGNSLAITLYGALAAFGMTAITTFLVHQAGGIHLVGGLFLLYLGFKTVFSRPAAQASREVSRSLEGEVLSSFLLSLVNPMTILLFAAAFTSTGLSNAQSNAFSALQTVLGVFFGSILWRGLSIGGISFLRGKLLRHTGWINRISGAVLIVLSTTSIFRIF